MVPSCRQIIYEDGGRSRCLPVRTVEVSYPQNSNRVLPGATALQPAFRKYWSQSSDGPACRVIRNETVSGFARSSQKNHVVFTRLRSATLYDSCHIPDCAADGCKSLRIIDANAEAYRYEAMPPRS
jgi:hypothetical protein